MVDHRDQGQANLTLLVVLLGLIVAGVWIWKRLTPDTQDYVIDQAIPTAAIGLTLLVLLFIPIRAFHRRSTRTRERARLLTLFERETAQTSQTPDAV